MAKNGKKIKAAAGGGDSLTPVSKPEGEVFFEDIVDDVVERMRAVLLGTYDRRATGAFSFGLQGLAAVATEQLAQARGANDLFNSATFTLAATLLSVDAYAAKRRPTTRPTAAVRE